MKHIIPLDVEVDLGEGIDFSADRKEELLDAIANDIVAALCCDDEVESALANEHPNINRVWKVDLDWNRRGGFEDDAASEQPSRASLVEPPIDP